MSKYFPPSRSRGGDIKVKLDLSNYATKIDLKNVTHVDVSSFASKTNLASLKTEADKLDIDLTKYVKKSDYDTKVGNLELKILDVSGLLQTSTFNAKVSELENKIKTAE